MMAVHGVTDIGLRRTQNEDHFAYWPPEAAARERDGLLIAVADGMGGALAGEVASQLAVDAALGVWRSANGEPPTAVLRRAVEAANLAVHEESLARPDRHGMGTTLTLVVCRGDRAWVAHVGDSRAYLVRHGAIRQLTEDHSLVAQLVREQQMTPEQARVDHRRNVVTRSVGVGEHVDIDVLEVPEPLEHGDTLVVTTDGLHGLVEDDEIAGAVARGELGPACDALVDLARERGGYDNITVVMARL